MTRYADAIVDALRARGFELFVSVGASAPVHNKISVIKEVRRITGFALKEAVDAVERGRMLFDALTPEQAERVSERLVAAGATSSLLLTRAHLYAFVPEHPLRGMQICERLTVEGQTLELARGQVGAWGSEETLSVAQGELLAVIDRQRASWAAEGKRETASELEIVQRVSARNEQLEARIRAAEGETLAHEAAVYGDWLQSEGDPRGYVGEEVMLETIPHLFGPARPLFAYMQLEWIGPMIAAVRLEDASDAEFRNLTLLEQLLALPACACLRKLGLGFHFKEHPQLCGQISRSSCASSLRQLSITKLVHASFVNAKFERLEELELACSRIEFTSLSVPSLRRLKTEFHQPAVRLEECFSGLDAPALEHFEFGGYVYEYWDDQRGPLQSNLAAVLDLPSFARLRTLKLCSMGGTPYHAGLVQLFSRMPARHTLEYIDLREATIEDGLRAELEAARSSLPELRL